MDGKENLLVLNASMIGEVPEGPGVERGPIITAMDIRVTISGVYILEGRKNRFSSSGGNLGSRKTGEVVLNNQSMLVVRCGAEKVDVDIYPWIIGH